MPSVSDPFKQFYGVGFEESSLAALSPLGMSSVIGIAHKRIKGLSRIVVNFFPLLCAGALCLVLNRQQPRENGLDAARSDFWMPTV